MKLQGNIMKAIAFCVMGFLPLIGFTQTDRSCLTDVLRIEELNSVRKDTALDEKNIYMSYMIKATNWDDETSISNVKMYKQGLNMHFLSEQVNIYMDEKEVLLVLPIQKMLVLNSGSKEIDSYRLTDDFFEMRKEFIDSCEIVKCETRGDKKVLSLKVNPKKVDASVMITHMVYEYSLLTNKILSVKINYKSDYKLKQLIVVYKEFTTESTYKFPPLRRQVIDRKGNIHSKYQDYEIVDNRDKKNKHGNR